MTNNCIKYCYVIRFDCLLLAEAKIACRRSIIIIAHEETHKKKPIENKGFD